MNSVDMGDETDGSIHEFAIATIEFLLRREFDGAAELRAQWRGGADLRPTGDDDNYGSLKIVPRGGPAATVRDRVHIEAEFDDLDGVPVALLLHVIDGRLDELEIFKRDGSPLLQRPTAASLRILGEAPQDVPPAPSR